MASLADLNVRIGATIKGLQTGLKNAERSLKQSGSRLSSIGQDLSAKVSLPLAAIGGAALKSFADFERLEKAFLAVAGSADLAQQQINSLREVAKNPGITFDQAVAGSLKLQGLGFSAEKAEEAIRQVGNAIAVSGGTSQEFSGVIRQLGQIQAKNKVLQEDVGILLENAPVLGKVLQDTFGGRTGEAIREAGFNGEQFVTKLIGGLQKLERVEGGLSNSFENFGIALKVTLADIGRDLNETFNVGSNLDKLSSVISKVGQSFANLNDGTKSFLVISAGVVAVLPLLVSGIGFAVSNFATFASVSIKGFTLLTGGILKAASAFAQLNLITKLSTIGIIAAAAAAAVIAFRSLTKSFGELNAKAKINNEINTAANKAIVEERLSVQKLQKVLDSETATRREKQQALQQLKAINSDYFGDLDIENGKVKGLSKSVEGYIKLLTQQAKVKAAQEKLVEIEKQLIDINDQVDQAKPSVFQSLGNAILSVGNATQLAQRQASTFTNNLAENRTELEKQKDALLGIITANQQNNDAVNNAANSTKSLNNSLSNSNPKVTTAKEEVFNLNKNLGEFVRTIESAVTPTTQLGEALRNNLIDGGQAAFLTRTQQAVLSFAQTSESAISPLVSIGEQLEIIANKSEVLGAAFDADAARLDLYKSSLQNLLNEGLSPQSNAITTLIDKITELEEKQAPFAALETSAKAAASAFSSAASTSAKSFSEIGKAALSSASQVVKAKIVESIAAYIASSFGKLGLFGTVLAAGAGSVVGGLFNKVLSSVNVPALASGGLAFGETLALVGDNPNASTDPEVIAPLSKLKQFIQPNGGSGFVASTRISGSDLEIIINRALEQKLRTR